MKLPKQLHLLQSPASMAIRRMLYANFLISARLFLDFFAGDLSSRNVSSNTWRRRFSELNKVASGIWKFNIFLIQHLPDMRINFFKEVFLLGPKVQHLVFIGQVSHKSFFSNMSHTLLPVSHVLFTIISNGPHVQGDPFICKVI